MRCHRLSYVVQGTVRDLLRKAFPHTSTRWYERYRVLPEPYIFRDAHETVRFSYTEVVTRPAKCAIVFVVLISTKMFEEVSSLRESGSHP